MAAPLSRNGEEAETREQTVDRRLGALELATKALRADATKLLVLAAASATLEELAQKAPEILDLERRVDGESDIRGRDYSELARRLTALERCREGLERLDLPAVKGDVERIRPLVDRHNEELAVIFDSLRSIGERVRDLQERPQTIVETLEFPEGTEEDLVRAVVEELARRELDDLRRQVNDLQQQVASFRRRVGEISGFESQVSRFAQELEGLRMAIEGIPSQRETLDIRQRALRETADLRQRVGTVERRVGELEGRGPGPSAPPPLAPPAPPRRSTRARQLGLMPPE